MQSIDLNTARAILDFSGGDAQLEQLGELQLQGAVALQNMLSNPEVGVGYLADEVGMGKTYIALGVVAMMRYFNPAYRVLYICPSRNVQEKWYGREHPNFIKQNVTTSNFNIRTPSGYPGTPSISCSNVEELIIAATTGYYGDIFVRSSSFSMGMTDDEYTLRRHLRWLADRVPGIQFQPQNLNKRVVKLEYARAINYLLPMFDLVVIDEAHNFKHDFESSDRNMALSRVLGFNSDGGLYKPRVRSALLLSATPFDLNPEHLFNQLNLVGKSDLLPMSEEWRDKKRLKFAMEQFMVRRLNVLNIRNKPHTRNMYRREWRKGKRVEIEFESDEHKLVTALVQKKIGELLNKEGASPSFQMGLLASFESYAQTSQSGPVEFDGEKATDIANDAKDRHLIGVIRDSYVVEKKFGKTLPHPKMDQVCRDLSHQALENGRKQLVFVRRVKSVAELKQKLDDHYNDWLQTYIETELESYPQAKSFMTDVIEQYSQINRNLDEDFGGVDFPSHSDDAGDTPAAKSDNLFNWFFRGEQAPELEKGLSSDARVWPFPADLKKALVAKKNQSVLLFEFNWVEWILNNILGQTVDNFYQACSTEKMEGLLEESGLVPEDDLISIYLSSQRIFLKLIAQKHPDLSWVMMLVSYLEPLIRTDGEYQPEIDEVLGLLQAPTLFSFFSQTGRLQHLFSSPEQLLKIRSQQVSHEVFHRIEVHRQLIAQCFRTGHGFVDLYLARLKVGSGDLNAERRQTWLKEIIHLLDKQRDSSVFGTELELSRLNENLDLIIKSNLPGLYRKSQAELRRWLNQQLPSSSPIIGATGATSGNRSIQARKFRMPGYPLVLLSTDVFQEGEDLHTFCDSVVHYGLSYSPVSIEQKTGRVDRVGALAHRRLLDFDEVDEVTDDDYIQVSFPFVKQSLEAIQVRVLCERLNDFIGSLHEIGNEQRAMDEFIDSSRELASRSEIPNQLMCFLTSPYVPDTSVMSSPQLKLKVESDNKKYQSAVEHVWNAVAKIFGENVHNRINGECVIESAGGHRYTVRLDSARACGEMLLKVISSNKLEQKAFKAWRHQEVCSRQAKHYEQSICRTFGIRETDGLALYQDAEMLVGGFEFTCEKDVRMLFERFDAFDAHASSPSNVADIQMFLQKDINTWLCDRYQWQGELIGNPTEIGAELIFRFAGDTERRHRINISLYNGYCLFEAMVADPQVVQSMSLERLLELTWLRNRNIDIVEFLVNPDGALLGRAVHGAAGLDFDEFVFNAYTLAVEADRLEYLIKLPDEY